MLYVITYNSIARQEPNSLVVVILMSGRLPFPTLCYVYLGISKYLAGKITRESNCV